MPVTLAQAKVGMADHVDQQVIDDFRRGSQLLDALRVFLVSVSKTNKKATKSMTLWLKCW